jgi:predicted GNAT family acetyltransferase
VAYTNPKAKPGDGMKFSMVETRGTNGATRFNAYRSAIKPDAITYSRPDASALVRNGKIESVWVNPDWRGSGLYGQLRSALSDRKLEVAEDSPKSASYLSAEAKFAAR